MIWLQRSIISSQFRVEKPGDLTLYQSSWWKKGINGGWWLHMELWIG
jgi:hypothetical protein